MTRTLTPEDLAATFDAFNRHDINGVMTRFADDCVFYTVAGPEVYGSKVEGAEAIAKASAQRGRPCLYFAHISGALDSMRQRALQAKRFGATGLLVAPGLTGFDALRVLALDENLGLPIASHPSFLGAYISGRGQGLAPAVGYALLPRLSGTDMAIYPGFGGGYSMSNEDCASVAVNCRKPWGTIHPAMPAVGGRIEVHRIAELTTTMGQDAVFVLGSRIQQDQRGVSAAVKEFQLVLAQSSSSAR